MKKILSILLVALLAFSWAAAESDAATQALSFMTLLNEQKFDEAFEQSDEQMQTALVSADSYATIWSQLLQYGAYQGALGATEQSADGITAVTLECDFTSAILSLQIALNADGDVCGLLVTGARAKPEETTASAFRTETVALRPGEASQTDALLTLPEGDGPFPAAVLVHGSGPSDKDESAYGFKPFAELANGLAELGVASLRYDKFTYAHADLLSADDVARFTVDVEYLLDVSAAVAALDADPRVSEIYLIGHSQGAMLAPRLISQIDSEKLAGAVLLCGTPRHMWEIQYDQNLAILDTLSDEQAAEGVKTLEAELLKLDAFADMTEEELAAQTFFGLGAIYQMDEMAVDAAQAALANDLPLLLIGGGKDWQVTPENGLDAWREALGEWNGAAYLFYPDMNHFLCDQEGEPAGNATDYANLQGLSPTLVSDIASWIQE